MIRMVSLLTTLLFILTLSSCDKGGQPDAPDGPHNVMYLAAYPDYEPSYDMFSLDSAYIQEDSIFLHIGYSGGCKDHLFNLWVLESLVEQNPPHVMLEHISNGDMCEAYIQCWVSFNLKPMRQADKSEIQFILRGNPLMSSFFGTFVYRY